MNSKFLQLRYKLDEAITFGDDDLALSLANEGLVLAKKEDLKSEIEYFRGQIEMLNENYTKAMEHFDKAVKYNPNDGAAYNDKALCMIEFGKIDEAIYYFDKGIEVEPDYVNVYHNKGWLLNNIGRHRDAINYFKKALELEPNRAVTYENLADALVNISDFKGAIKAYEKAISLLNPNYSGIISQLIERIHLIKEKIANGL